jgi:dual specificity tyrosine-phosphorylation-regulated kinase 2/3/4
MSPDELTSPSIKRLSFKRQGKSNDESTLNLLLYDLSPHKDSTPTLSHSSKTPLKSRENRSKEPHLFPKKSLRKPPPKPKFISPTRALLDFFELLSNYERNEISQYEEIYFIGKDCEKNTKGFDDEDGYYIPVFGDHLGYRYEIKDLLGCGTFGQVFHCFDYKRKQNVAVKIIRKKMIYRRAGELENKILHELSKADPNDVNCIVKKLRSFEFRGHLCLVFELLSLNLYDFHQKNSFKGLSLQLIRRISVQLFMALKTVHSVGIIHCDLKPENILLKFENKSSIKVIDFGSACQEGNKVYDYVQSRFYRAPEVVLDAGYDHFIDIWSVGCILFELLTGFPLFPAENEQDLFSMIIEVLGPPPSELLEKGKRKHFYVDSNGRLRKNVKPFSRTISDMLQDYDENVRDLIDKCIQWRPQDRIDAEQGLSHGWVKGCLHREN